jgi:multidrug resistance efflux pump
VRRAVLLLAAALVACGPRPAPHPSGPPAAASLAVAKGVVEVEGGLLRVIAPRDGQLVAPLAEEGAEVAAGQVLARLDDRQPQLLLASAVADQGERAAQAQVAAAHAAGAAREAQRLAALAAADAATGQDADQAQTAAAVARGEQRQAEAGLRAAEARRRLAAYEIQARTVRAPVAGRVVRRTAAPCAYVAANTPLFVLAPDGVRVVRAELDEAFADRVKTGQRATVSREFQDGRSYEAWVLRVSDLLAGPALVDDGAARADTRVVSVVLALPPDADLRLGQRVLVRFAR